MKKLLPILTLAMLLPVYPVAAQIPVAPPSGYVPVPVAPAPVVVAPPPYCRAYTDSFMMGSEKRITRGIACLQPDGSWELHPAEASVRYVNRGNGIFLVPAQPFATVIIKDGHAHHHHLHDIR